MLLEKHAHLQVGSISLTHNQARAGGRSRHRKDCSRFSLFLIIAPAISSMKPMVALEYEGTQKQREENGMARRGDWYTPFPGRAERRKSGKRIFCASVQSACRARR